MTLRKKKLQDEYETLRPDDLIDKRLPLTATIVKEPTMVQTKFQDEQPYVVLDFGQNRERGWFANWTSFNFLIDKLGHNEHEWVGKKVTLQVLTQVIQGTTRDVIYAAGSKVQDKKGVS